VVSSTKITVNAPAHAAGTVDVTVTTPGGTSAIVAGDKFTYIAAPTITGISPASGDIAGGTLVTVTGTNLTGATAVKFGTTAGTSVTVVSSTKITVKAPAHAAGIVDVTVTTPGGTSAIVAGDKYTYTARPIVTSITPKLGPLTGGALVTITGYQFTGATAVKFGNTLGTSKTVVSSTKITIRSPAHAAGTLDVRVTTAKGTSPVIRGDQYIYTTRPIVTSISPTSGTHSGGTTVTITGYQFTGATAVKFGTALGTSKTVVSSIKITVKAPAHAAGTVDVKVTTAKGTSPIIATDKFKYT